MNEKMIEDMVQTKKMFEEAEELAVKKLKNEEEDKKNRTQKGIQGLKELFGI